jgi:prevent-host-death family protein
VKIVSITEAKNRLSALIDHVRGGETVLIMDHGRPVARLESAVAIDEAGQGRLSRLERAGIVQIAAKKLGEDLIKTAPPRARKNADVVRALLEERRESR